MNIYIYIYIHINICIYRINPILLLIRWVNLLVLVALVVGFRLAATAALSRRAASFF